MMNRGPRSLLPLCAALHVLALAGCGGEDPDDRTPGSSPTPTPPYGLTGREPNLTCTLSGLPETPPPMRLERAFPGLVFNQPVFLTHPGDGTGRLFVLERAGLIKVFPDQADAQAEVFLDLREPVSTEGIEMGLLGLAFHPAYSINGYFYVNYTIDNPRRTVISRFRVSADDPDRADPGSERTLLEFTQPQTNHNGGMLAFGPDGYLYIATGDGGAQGDPDDNAQNTHNLLGKILRIDVDRTLSDAPYAIPLDNPFALATDGRRPEIYAWGFRNPWRFSFDRATGRLWAGDVGQNAYEEIDLVELGGNYGWNVMEGNHCYGDDHCDEEGLIPPILEYPHSEGRSVTGGYVYRGLQRPELYGHYLYADFSSGRISAIEADGSTAPPDLELAATQVKVSSFGEDEAGELYLLDYEGGTLQRLEPAEPSPSTGPFPTRLSETGCFSDLRARVPAPGVIPYEVNSPLYSDYTRKRRWMALPGTARIGFTETGAWALPDDTLLIKDFYLEEVSGDASSERLLETRFLVKRSDGWLGFTYRWNEEQTDAVLLEGAETDTFILEDAQGSTIEYTHYFPSRSDCQSCHTAVSGFALGLRTGQLNREADYDGVIDNQLRSFNHIGLFMLELEEPYDRYPRFPSPEDEQEPLEGRARSYLEANCAHCHQPGGNATADIDLRYETPFAETRTCGVEPALGDMGMAGAMLIAPGEPSRSVVSLRMHTTGEGRMPNLATGVPDPLGTSVVDAWISELERCP